MELLPLPDVAARTGLDIMAVRQLLKDGKVLAVRRPEDNVLCILADQLEDDGTPVKHLPAVIIRPEAMFGPGDRLNFKRLADRLRAGRGIIIGSGRNAVPFVYVTDVIQGLLLALEHERAVGQAYNITNDQPLTQEEFLTAIAQEVGAPPPRLHVPYRALYAAAYVAEGIDRTVRLTFTPISGSVTRLGITVKQGVIRRDRATASEIVTQIEEALVPLKSARR